MLPEVFFTFTIFALTSLTATLPLLDLQSTLLRLESVFTVTKPLVVEATISFLALAEKVTLPLVLFKFTLSKDRPCSTFILP